MPNLTSPAAEISPITRKLSAKLKKLKIEIVEDLIFYYPFRYDDFSSIKKIADLNGGDVVTIKGRVDLIENRRSSLQRKNITQAIISDETGSINAVWFNQPYIIKSIRTGENIYLAGKIDLDYSNPQMKNPEYEKINYSTIAGRLAPVYHLTAGITNKQIRFMIKLSLPATKDIKDWLPIEIQNRAKLIPLNIALTNIHFPQDKNALNQAARRLKFDELFLIQMKNLIAKNRLKKNSAEIINFKEAEIKKFVANLPFKLTDDQKKSSWTILKDLQKPHPMNRLLEGDVGCGKTVVAAIAMLNVALNKKQSAYMAPTEILAKQHFTSISKLLEKFNIKIGLITRSERKMNQELRIKNQRLNKNKKKSNDYNSKFIIQNSDIIIGTHAIIQNKIKFKNLVLAIIDEQHRFGVEQRKDLSRKLKVESRKLLMPHFLSMTATPIPRTLHLALDGDLDLSVIKEMPKNRKKVLTKIVEAKKRQKTYKFIREQIEQGRQIFVICPLIDPSDKLGVKSVSEEYEKLNNKIFPNIKIEVLHGKLKAEEKEKIMQNFLSNKTKILVATSVVEVGVDIPNAAIMMIEGAERFGLAQLHQFRGRVGRSAHQSYCLLFSDNLTDKASNRLEALVSCNDGFELARRDLEFRGAGDIYGQEQSGLSKLKIATLFDYELMQKARVEATQILKTDPELKKFPKLKSRMEEFEKSLHLE